MLVIFALLEVKEPILKPICHSICFKQTCVWCVHQQPQVKPWNPPCLPSVKPPLYLRGSSEEPKNLKETKTMHALLRWSMEEADWWIREWGCEQGAPTPYGSASSGQQVPRLFPRKKEATFPLEEEWVDIRLQPCPLMEIGFTGW